MPAPFETPLSQQLWSRIVYITAIAAFLLLWLFAWSWSDEPISNTDERHLDNQDWTPSVTFDPMVELPSNVSGLCNPDTYNQGQWTLKPIKAKDAHAIEQVANYHCPSNFPHKCYRRSDEGGEFDRAKHIMDYTWVPNDCSLVPFDAGVFAKYLGDHPLLFVGDSINQLEYESLACLLGQHMHNPPSDTHLSGGNPNMWISQLVHEEKMQVEGAVSMAYLRSDYLVRLDDFKLHDPMDEEGYLIGKGSNFPWKHALDRFDNIIINTGPHWHPDLRWGPNKSEKELLDAFSKGMRVVFEYLKEHVKPRQRVFIRSTPYGHAKCSQYKQPDVKTPHAPSGQPGEYEWHMHEQFDSIWKNWIVQENDMRFRFFNVSTMANLRGDAHSRPDSDCLHTCLPGPVDDWNRLLYNEIAKASAGLP